MITVHMIGNAHLDPVWLWPWQEGADEALATFRSAADRCDEYPEFIYTRGEAWTYERVAELDPELFARVRKLVSEGRWHVPSPQYIQPDCNLPTLEGWHAQFRRGRKYFEATFGLKPRCGYNVDSFGHPPTLPDILNAHGCDSYVFHRPSPQQMALPAQTFRWRGIEGGEVIAHRIIPAYVTRSDDLYGQIKLALESMDSGIGHALCFYGVGNHGGGPTKGNIEFILENRERFEGARLEFSTLDNYFSAVAEGREKLPVVEGELQYTFPGCYSVMHRIKQAQYHGEHRMRRVGETVRNFIETSPVREAELSLLDKSWDDLLFTQFHDILAGTSIPSSWSSVEAMQGRAQITAEEILYRTTRRWASQHLPPVNQQQLVLINTAEEAFEGLVEAEPFLDFAPWGDRWLSDEAGNSIPFQRIQPEACIALANRVVFPVRVPARSGIQILVRDDSPTLATEMKHAAAAEKNTLKNFRLSVQCGKQGVDSLRFGDKAMLGAKGLSLQLREDHTDTWTFHADRFDGAVVEEGLVLDDWQVEEAGPLRARLRAEGKIGNSRVRWTLTLPSDDDVLEMKLEVVFAEKYRALQMVLQTPAEIMRRVDGISGGRIGRSSSPCEFPFQKGTMVAGEAFGMAIATADCWSLSQEHDTLQLTLLRSPRMAWGGRDADIYGGREDIADQGKHVFEFRLRPGEGADFSRIEKDHSEMVEPLVCFNRYEGMNRPPWKNSPPRILWTGAEQRARKDGEMQHLEDSGEASIEDAG